MSRSTCKLFADNSNLTIKSRTDKEIIQSDLFKLCDWSKECLLPFNIVKCKAIHYENIYFATTDQMKGNDGQLKDLCY